MSSPTLVPTTRPDEQLVCDVLQAAGARGASHEDFVEAGLASDYIGALRRLVDEDGLQIRVDFATGMPRWVVSAAPQQLRAA
jgi:hypothetical protein